MNGQRISISEVRVANRNHFSILTFLLVERIIAMYQMSHRHENDLNLIGSNLSLKFKHLIVILFDLHSELFSHFWQFQHCKTRLFLTLNHQSFLIPVYRAYLYRMVKVLESGLVK